MQNRFRCQGGRDRMGHQAIKELIKAVSPGSIIIHSVVPTISQELSKLLLEINKKLPGRPGGSDFKGFLYFVDIIEFFPGKEIQLSSNNAFFPLPLIILLVSCPEPRKTPRPPSQHYHGRNGPYEAAGMNTGFFIPKRSTIEYGRISNSFLTTSAISPSRVSCRSYPLPLLYHRCLHKYPQLATPIAISDLYEGLVTMLLLPQGSLLCGGLHKLPTCQPLMNLFLKRPATVGAVVLHRCQLLSSFRSGRYLREVLR